MKSKCIKDLNAGAKPIKLLGENTGLNLCHLGSGNGFPDATPQAQATEKNIGKPNATGVGGWSECLWPTLTFTC